MNTPTCRAQNPASCRFHGQSLPKNSTLSSAYPKLASQFIENLTRPQNSDPNTIKPQSSDRAKFKCECGEYYESRIAHASRQNILKCSACRRVGKSRLEFEVSELLSSYLKTNVEQNYGNYNPGGHTAAVDLYIPKLDCVIQLDPYHSHSKKLDLDKKVYEEMKNSHAVAIRVREKPLPEIENNVAVAVKATSLDYFNAIKAKLNLSMPDLSPSEIESSLCEANIKWDEQSSLPEESVAETEYALEFVKNITHPGRDARYTPKSSRDLCEWLCLKGHTWVIRAQVRGMGSKCPKCHFNRIAPYEKSLAGKNPEIAKYFVKSLKEGKEDYTSDQIYAASMELAQWKCNICGKEWVSNINSQARLKIHAGCTLQMRKTRKDKGTHKVS